MSEPLWDFIKASYVTSAVKPQQYPEGDLPEVAFVGRSNVGKSSLINSLCRNRHLAKTSGSPGKTRTINFFAVEAKRATEQIERQRFFLVDLPGYGFAKASKVDKKQWSSFIELYVTKSQRLQVIFQLIDIRHDLMANDRECFNWLVGMGVPLQIVLTKLDKLSQTAAAAQKKSICRALGIEPEQVVAYSAVSNKGRQDLIDRIMAGVSV